jgi:hypothetical protein
MFGDVKARGIKTLCDIASFINPQKEKGNPAFGLALQGG